MRWIFLIFIIIPVLEMLVLIEVGSVLGSVPTVALVFITAIIGVTMLRQQGLSTLLSFNQKLNTGELPANELLSAAFLIIAGAFLLTPGFVTDSIGFLLLIPFVRHLLADYFIKKGMLSAAKGFEQSQFYSFFEERSQASGNVYDAQEKENQENKSRSKDSDSEIEPLSIESQKATEKLVNPSKPDSEEDKP
jgi:UPF0716 protein FxsA